MYPHDQRTHIYTYIDIMFIVIMSLISIINQLVSSRQLTDKPSPSFRWIRNGILM